MNNMAPRVVQTGNRRSSDDGINEGISKMAAAGAKRRPTSSKTVNSKAMATAKQTVVENAKRLASS